jgi:hypothetical protein
MNRDVPRQERPHSWDKRAGAELGEGVMPPIGGDDVVAGLGPAVEAHYPPGPRLADEGVGEQPLAGIPEAEVDNDEYAQIA